METLKGWLAVGTLRAIALLPWPVVQKLGRLLGWLMYRLPNRSTQVARINLQHCFPTHSPTEREQLLQENLKNTGQSFTESACAWIWPVQKTLDLVREVEGFEVLEQARASGKAVIGITSHLGNWEVLNHYYSRHNNCPVMFYRPPKLKALDALLARQRSQLGNRVAPSTQEGILSVIREVRKGGAVGIPADPEPALKSGVFVPFLAVQALTSKFIAGMVGGKQERVAAVFLHAIRLADGSGFKIIIEAAPDDIYSKDVTVSTAALSRTLARYVERWPEQYMWTMKRFRRRPDGEARWY
ncbi:MAG: lysophospholipid acyltransferase [Thiopseudomonas sp.]|nr:lysophospholipid acyltransferase [Thiopseudomonas sp.]